MNFIISPAPNISHGDLFDQPPFSIAVLWGWVSIAGNSIVSLRVLAALIGTIPIAMAGLITRQLGGEWKAQGLTCFAVLLAPIQIGISSFYSMNVIEYALILLLVWLLLRIIKERQSFLWIPFGIVLGMGIMNKHTFALLAGCMLVGIIFTPARKEFLKKVLLDRDGGSVSSCSAESHLAILAQLFIAGVL